MNTDTAGNPMMLTPSMCETCILKRRNKTTRRNITCCIFVAYNILVLSVVFVTFWYIFDSRERLDRTERIVTDLQQQGQQAEVYANGLPTQEHSLQIPEIEHKDRLKRSNTDEITESIRKRIKRGNNKKRRGGKKKRCKNCLPVVQIEGKGTFGNEDKSDLSDLWITPSWLPTGKKKNYDVSSVVKTGKIKVLAGGLYILYAQMNLIGPSIKGFEVFKEEDNSAPECITSCKRNSDLDYTETCFTLKMTLAGVSKRGYHIRKEKKKKITTIASCVTYSNEDNLSEDDAKHMVSPCPALTVVKLDKDDEVFIQELDGNSSVLYSNGVFGLIRIGA